MYKRAVKIARSWIKLRLKVVQLAKKKRSGVMAGPISRDTETSKGLTLEALKTSLSNLYSARK